MNHKPKVSVIIPTYNPGIHFEKCLNSLVSQTLKEIEIIVVLDCPTDGSEKIAEAYKNRYSNIVLIYNKSNLHTGESRNRGYEVAHGKYVNFFDADDYCHENMFEELYTLAEQKKADVVFSKQQMVKPNEITYPDKTPLSSIQIEDGTHFTAACLLGTLSSSPHFSQNTLHTHIYRKDFLQKHNIFSLDTRQFGYEDNVFNTQTYLALIENKGILLFVPKQHYCYVRHENNTGNTSAYWESRRFAEALEHVGSLIKSAIFSTDILQIAYYQRCIRNLYSVWRHNIKYNRLKAFKNLSVIKNYPTLYSAVKHPPKKIAICQQREDWQIPYITPAALTRMPITKRCFALMLKWFY